MAPKLCFPCQSPHLGHLRQNKTDQTTGFQTAFPCPSPATQRAQIAAPEAGPGASQEDMLNPTMGNPPPIPVPTAAKAPARCSLVKRLGIQVELIVPWGRQIH